MPEKEAAGVLRFRWEGLLNLQSYFYNCSPDHIESIHPNLLTEVRSIIRMLPKRETQSEIKEDLFWLFTHKGWCYDTVPAKANPECPFEVDIMQSLDVIRDKNLRELCLTSSTLETRWHADFAKRYGTDLVQVETQFGKVEAMFKDFCGFRIAYAERRLALGIEIVLADPPEYFAHRKNAFSGMASFDIAKYTLATIGLDSPIWVVGVEE
jgi:hypothetical protein